MDLPPPKLIDTGTPGASAEREYGRRRTKHDAALEAQWGTGRMGRVARFFSEEPQTTTAWAKGSDGERRLGEQLNRDLADVGIVLHDRQAQPGKRWNIDHLAIAPTGVWVIDAKSYRGRIERRDHGGWRRIDDRLYVNGRDQTQLVHSMDWQESVVRPLLGSIGFGDVPIHSALCFTDSEWSLIARPFRIDDVWVIWAKRLVKEISREGALDDSAVWTIGHHLADKMPPA